MTLLWYMLGGFGVSVLAYLLTIFYIRRRDGIWPGYAGLLIMCISMGGFLLVLWVLRRFGLDLLHGGPHDIFWLILGFDGLALLFGPCISGTRAGPFPWTSDPRHCSNCISRVGY